MVADGGNQSVERSARVLAAFSNGSLGQQLRVAEVAKECGLGVSTASRLLATLEKVGFVQRDPLTQLYSLGSELITLGGAALNRDPVLRASRQIAQDLAAATGFGANVAIRDGANLFYLCNFEGRHAPRSFTLQGQRNPLAATALGKCLLAGLSASDRRTLVGNSFHKYTASTLDSHDRLDAEVQLLGQRGYTTEVEELALGRACIAAPIRDTSGEIVAGLSMSGPLTALNLAERERDHAARIVEAADQISVQLGYSPSPALAMAQ